MITAYIAQYNEKGKKKPIKTSVQEIYAIKRCRDLKSKARELQETDGRQEVKAQRQTEDGLKTFIRILCRSYIAVIGTH